MKKYPNYRVAVEVLLIKDGKVFLAKRADDCQVVPGKWNVPAGKVKYEEIPAVGAVREALEETELEVEVEKEVGVRAFKFELEGEDAFRLVYTYAVKQKDPSKEPVINYEHSTCEWVSKEQLDDEKFENMSVELKEIIKKVL